MSTSSPVSAVEPLKIRLTDEQVETANDALKVAAAAMRGAALLAESMDETFTAQICEERARRFEDLLSKGEGVARITVRY